MRYTIRALRTGAIAAATFFIPFIARAHEVYVLTPGEIQTGLTRAPFDEIAVAFSNISEFVFWAFIAVLAVLCVFFISISRFLENRLEPLFERIKKYAAPIARMTVGISFLAAAYYQASYGPELPLQATFGPYSLLVTAVLSLIGVFIVFGIYARASAVVAVALFSIAVWYHGMYMLTYTNYLGEIIVLLILGTHDGAAPRALKSVFDRAAAAFAPYAFLVLRVCFGISLLYASFYAKILHNNLALQVAELPLAGHAQSLSQVFGLEPHFLVLGAAIVEIVIALFFILGIEIRFTSFFLLFWLSLSLWWFGEVVWPHVILIGIPIAFICWGYDAYSLEGWLFKKGAREPVL